MIVETIKLGELCEVRSGGTPSKGNFAYWGGDIPWISPKDMKSAVLSEAADYITEEAIENSATSLLPPQTILIVVRSGILAHSLPVARAARPLAFNQDIKALIPDQHKIEPEYLYWFLRSSAPIVLRQGVKKGATVHSVQSGFIESLNVPIATRQEQKRIIDLLGRADGIVRLRRQAQEKAAELVPAIFRNMFGKERADYARWPVVTLGDYAEIQSSVKIPSIDAESEEPCIGADSIESNTGRIVSWPTVAEVMPRSAKYRFQARDVLYSKIRPNLCKAALAPSSGYCSADMYPLTTNQSVLPEFLLALLLSRSFTDYAIRESVRAQMPKLNRETLFAYTHRLPPIELQREFAVKAQAVWSIERQQADAAAVAETAFTALLTRAFDSSGFRVCK